jgi:hypothetical protein
MTGLLSDCRAHGHNDLTAKGEMTLTNKASRCFEFDKRCQRFIRSHNETLSVAAMRVCNPNRSPFGIACEVWKRHAKAFFGVRRLARSPDILPRPCGQHTDCRLRLRGRFCG